MTDRSRAVAEAIWAEMRALQAEWRAEIGEADFATFIAVLRRLAQPEAPPPPASPRS